ncbi:MAG: GDSL-type esterase/lipase family protein [Acidimicrobiales bacterium]
MRRAGFAVLVLCGLLGACGLGDPAATPTVTTDPPVVVSYVAIGGDRSGDDDPDSQRRQVWPRLLFREHLPAQAVFALLSRPGATVEEALRSQLPGALELEPTVATVWFTAGDVEQSTPVDRYRADLDELVGALADFGADVVVLFEAGTPSAYAEAAQTVAGAHGAAVVEVAEPGDQGQIAAQVAEALALPE